MWFVLEGCKCVATNANRDIAEQIAEDAYGDVGKAQYPGGTGYAGEHTVISAKLHFRLLQKLTDSVAEAHGLKFSGPIRLHVERDGEHKITYDGKCFVGHDTNLLLEELLQYVQD